MGCEHPVLSVEGLCFSYPGQQPLLENLGLQMRAGEVLALLGRSGSGKSSFLRVLAGLEQAQAGSIRLQDCEHVEKLPTEERNIGLLFQDYMLFPHLRVLDNVAFGLKASKRKRRSQALEMLEKASLVELAGRYAHQISGGQQQRVALLRALITQPKLMLLDEPFSNLDSDTKEQTRSYTFELLRNYDIPSILVTHDAQEAEHVADRIIYMEDWKNSQ